MSPRQENALEPPARDAISLSEQAVDDCELLAAITDAVINFVVSESERHRRLFTAPFSSATLLYGEDVIILSWDGTNAIVERVLNRTQAYPLNDKWTKALSCYRKATTLPYRTQDTDRPVFSAEMKRTLAHYERLVASMESLIDASVAAGQSCSTSGEELRGILDEAVFAAQGEVLGPAIVELEVLLSTIHKLILRLAPQYPRETAAEGKLVRTLPGRDPAHPAVLVVEDDEMIQRYFSNALQSEGFYVVCAHTTHEAMALLVDNDFAVAILDVMLGPDVSNSDGREVARAVRESNPSTKIIVCSAFQSMALAAKLGTDSFPCDLLLCKHDIRGMEQITTAVRGMIEDSASVGTESQNGTPNKRMESNG